MKKLLEELNEYVNDSTGLASALSQTQDKFRYTKAILTDLIKLSKFISHDLGKDNVVFALVCEKDSSIFSGEYKDAENFYKSIKPDFHKYYIGNFHIIVDNYPDIIINLINGELSLEFNDDDDNY